MKVTTEQFLDKLEANPQIAAEFDSIHPGITRRAHCKQVLDLIESTQAVNVASKAKLAAARAKIAALERVKASLPATRQALAAVRGKLIVAQAKAKRQAASPKPQASSITRTASGITSHSTRGGRAFRNSRKA